MAGPSHGSGEGRCERRPWLRALAAPVLLATVGATFLGTVAWPAGIAQPAGIARPAGGAQMAGAAQPADGAQPAGGRGGAPPHVVAYGQRHHSNLRGPVSYTARIDNPAPGALLVLGVVCGVVTDGMTAPALATPAGWQAGAHRIGGIDGGLETALYFRSHAPAGPTTLRLGTVPVHTNAYCTMFWAAYDGTAHVRLDRSGSTSNPWGDVISVRTARPTRTRDLVLLVSTDGTEVPHTDYTVTGGYRPVDEQTAGHRFQPGTFSQLITAAHGRHRGTVAWADGTTDSCAAMMALSV